jgi:hypothetical protein
MEATKQRRELQAIVDAEHKHIEEGAHGGHVHGGHGGQGHDHGDDSEESHYAVHHEFERSHHNIHAEMEEMKATQKELEDDLAEQRKVRDRERGGGGACPPCERPVRSVGGVGACPPCERQVRERGGL